MSTVASLSLEALCVVPCDWLVVSKIKRGPRAVSFCRTCKIVRRKQVCPLKPQPKGKSHD